MQLNGIAFAPGRADDAVKIFGQDTILSKTWKMKHLLPFKSFFNSRSHPADTSSFSAPSSNDPALAYLSSAG